MAEISPNDWMTLLERSGLLDAAQQQRARSVAAEQPAPADAAALADRVVKTGLITRFQADQLLAGRYKGFFLGKYRILSLLGTGGMGRVYLAEHTLMKRRVAIKVLPKGKGNDPSALARFQREARAVAALQDPNIVAAYDMDQEGDLHYMVMEFVAGMSAQDYVKERGRLPFGVAADFVRQAASGLDHAHHVGIVHRDIKPGNLLIDKTGVVKLLDLGLAVIFEEKEHDPLTLAFDENVLGTADYLSPEQALDSHNVDIRTDIYSLGCTLYCLLTGQSPFPEGTVAQKLLAHQNREPRPIRELAPEVPDDLVAVVRRMTAKKPEERYQTPREVVDALTPFAQPIADPFGDSPPLDPLSTPLSPRPSTSRPGLKPASPSLGSVPTGKPAPPIRVESPSLSAPISPTPVARPVPVGPPSSGGKKTDGSGAKKAVVKKAASSAAASSPAPEPQKSDSAEFLRSLAEQSSGSAAARFSTTSQSAVPSFPSAPAAPKFQRPSPRMLAAIAGGAVGLLSLGAIGWWLLRSKPPEASTVVAVEVNPAESAKAAGDLVVTKDAGGTHDSIDAALYEAKRGQVVAVRPNPAGKWDIPYAIRISPEAIDGMAGVTLAGSEPGVVVQLRPEATGPLLVIERTSGFVVRNLTLDGQGKPGPLVIVRGPEVAGVKLEGLTLRNFAGVGVQIDRADGSAARPVLMQALTFQGAKPDAVAVSLQGDDPAGKSKNVQFVDVKFLGPSAGAVRIGQPPTNLLLKDCRFEKLAWGVRLSAGAVDYKSVSLLGGVFEDVKERVVSDAGPAFISQVKTSPEPKPAAKTASKK